MTNQSNPEKQAEKMVGNEVVKKKPPKIEDKSFDEFINKHLIPEIKNEFKILNLDLNIIELKQTERPVVGGDCWLLFGEFESSKRFWISFETNNITSKKYICLSDSKSLPDVLESFLIDEKKMTLKLLTSRLMQRLNGQKWLGEN